jgi:hypothetical protein
MTSANSSISNGPTKEPTLKWFDIPETYKLNDVEH